MGTAASSAKDKSYLIVDASVSNKDKQPYWIAFTKAQRDIHVSASNGLVEVQPGKYELHHVDFDKSMMSGDTDRDMVTNKKARSGGGSQFFTKSLKLTVKPGLIYFVGNLQLTQKKSRKYNIELKQDTEFIEATCRKFPRVFGQYPVTDINNQKKMRVSCNGITP